MNNHNWYLVTNVWYEAEIVVYDAENHRLYTNEVRL